MVKPLRFLFIDMAKDGLASGRSAEMDICGFPSHGMKQAKLSVRSAQGSEFDAGAMWTEATNNPASAQLYKGVGATNRAVNDGLVKDLGRSFLFLIVEALRPTSGRWYESFGFAGNPSAVPVGDSDVAGMAKTAESGNAMHETIPDAGSGHEMFKCVDHTDGCFRSQGGKRVHFLPKKNRIAEYAFGDQTQPLMLFAKNKSATLRLHTFAIAFEHAAADIFALKRKTSGLDGEVGANGQADQVDGVGHGPGFIEVVDAPDEAAFDVAPGTEILDVQIAHSEDMGSIRKIRADLGPELRPAVVGGAEEREEFRLHTRVFDTQVFLIDMSTLGQPGFKVASGFDDVHAANNSVAGNGKSMAGGPHEARAEAAKTDS